MCIGKYLNTLTVNRLVAEWALYSDWYAYVITMYSVSMIEILVANSNYASGVGAGRTK